MDEFEEYSGRNFTHRLTVETKYPDKVIDHRTREFYDREYTRNSQSTPPAKRGLQMESVTEEPKRKRARAKAKATTTKQDQQLKEANNKDLKSKNIKP